MRRTLGTILAIVISTGVYFTIRYGLRPKPIPVMSPTKFAAPAELGAVIYKHLRQSVRTERVILLGSRPEQEADPRVWDGFTRAAAADGENVVVVSSDKPEGEPARVREQSGAGRMVVVLGPTPEVTHLVSGSLVRQFEAVMKHPVLTISLLPLAVTEDERAGLSGCLDRGSAPRLDCASANVSRKYARKALAPDQFWAAAERHGLKEYLVFVHLP